MSESDPFEHIRMLARAIPDTGIRLHDDQPDPVSPVQDLPGAHQPGAHQPEVHRPGVREPAAHFAEPLLPEPGTRPRAFRPPADIRPFADALRSARERRGLTQKDLGRLAGVPQSHISKIESGAVDLRLSSLLALAQVLDLELGLTDRAPAGTRLANTPSEESAPSGRPARAEARAGAIPADAMRREGALQ
jgi:transcriptional regulator with XRE-family HTH domain